MEGLYAIAKFAGDVEIPAWAAASAFFSVTRTPEELSVVAAQSSVPAGLNASRGWRMARVGVGIFVISTFDTDYLLVQQEEIPVVVETLEHAGHKILHLELLNS